MPDSTLTNPATSTTSASVQTHETNCGVRPSGPRDACPSPLKSAGSFRHSFWWHDRRRVHRCLDATFPDSQRSCKFQWCGENAHVEVSATDPPEYRINSENCRDRWCRACQGDRTRVIAGNIVEHLADRRSRFLTLTIKTHTLTLKQAVDKLYRSFAKLRLTKLWRRRVSGGVATCEIVRARTADAWHPHLHILVEGRYVPHDDLRRAWFKITGDSYIVHIQPTGNSIQAAQYVTKYLRKPVPSAIVRHPQHLAEAMKALHGRRMVTTFGDWRGLKLTEAPDRGQWQTVCTLRDLIERAGKGDLESKRILRRLMGQNHLDPNSVDAQLDDLRQRTLSEVPRAPPEPLFHPQGHCVPQPDPTRPNTSTKADAT